MHAQSKVPQTSPILPGYQNHSHGPPTWPVSLFSSPDLNKDDDNMRKDIMWLRGAVEELRTKLNVEKRSRAESDKDLRNATGTNCASIAALQEEIAALRLELESEHQNKGLAAERLQLLEERLGHGLRDLATRDMVIKEGESREVTLNKQLEQITREISTRHCSTVNELTALRQHGRDLQIKLETSAKETADKIDAQRREHLHHVNKLETAAKETADKINAQMREHLHHEKSTREGDINHLRDIVIGPGRAPTSHSEPLHRISADVRCRSFRTAELDTKVAHAKRSLKGKPASRDLCLDDVDATQATASADLEKKIAAFEEHMRTDTGISAADHKGVLERVSRLEMLIHREEDARERQVEFVECAVVKKLEEAAKALEATDQMLIAAVGDEKLARETHHVEIKGMFDDIESKHASAHDALHGKMADFHDSLHGKMADFHDAVQGKMADFHADLHARVDDLDGKHAAARAEQAAARADMQGQYDAAHAALHQRMDEVDSKHVAAHDDVHAIMADMRGQHEGLHELMTGADSSSLTAQLHKVEAYLDQEITNRESDINALTMYFWAQPLANKCSSIRNFAAAGGPDIVGQVGALDTAVQEIQKLLAAFWGQTEVLDQPELPRKHRELSMDRLNNHANRQDSHLNNHQALEERVVALESAPCPAGGADPSLASMVQDLQRKLQHEAHTREMNDQALEQQVDDSKLHTDEVAVHLNTRLNDLRDMLDNHSHEFDTPGSNAHAPAHAPAPAPAPVPAPSSPVTYASISMPPVTAPPVIVQRSLPMMSPQPSVMSPQPSAPVPTATLAPPMTYAAPPVSMTRSVSPMQVSQVPSSPTSYVEQQAPPSMSSERMSIGSQHISTGKPKYAPGHAH